MGAIDSVFSFFGWIARIVFAVALFGFAAICFWFVGSDEVTSGGVAIGIALGIASICYGLWILSGRAYFIIF